jgi:hypothetical protein
MSHQISTFTVPQIVVWVIGLGLARQLAYAFASNGIRLLKGSIVNGTSGLRPARY